MPATRNAPRAQTEKKPAATFPEVVLGQPVSGWLQVLRNDSWDPASVRVLAIHGDGQGVRLDSPIPLPRTTRIMVNITLQPSQALHVQGIVHATRKNGGGSIAVIRFEHQTETDRRTLADFAAAAPAPEQPMSTPPVPVAPLEKRRHQRFVKSVAVQYQQLRTDGEILPGEGQMVTLDIGGGGMKIRVDQRLHTGDLLYLHLPLDTVPFFGLGRVVWTQDSRVQDRFVAGLQFVDLSETEQQRLTRLLTPV